VGEAKRRSPIRCEGRRIPVGAAFSPKPWGGSFSLFHGFKCGIPVLSQNDCAQFHQTEISLKLYARITLGGRLLIRITAARYSLVGINSELYGCIL